MDCAAACWTPDGDSAVVGVCGKGTPTVGSGAAGASGPLSTPQCLDTASTSTSDGEATAEGEDPSEEDEDDAEDAEAEEDEDRDEARRASQDAGPGARPAPEGAGAPAGAAAALARAARGARKAAEPDTVTLLRALAEVLSFLASKGGVPQRSTCFHAVHPPPISVRDYLQRIAKYCRCSDACLVLGLAYMHRIVKQNPRFVVSTLNVHRLVLTSVVVAAKFWDDVFYSNEFYATVGGVRLSEFNVLEATFLKMINWNLCVPPEEYDQYLDRVLSKAWQP